MEKSATPPTDPPPRAPLSRAALRLRALLLAAALAAAFLYPFAFNGPPLCLFHTLTRFPCPGCGLTRSLSSAAHAHLAESLRWHALGIPLLATAALLLALALLDLLRGTSHYSRLTSHPAALRLAVAAFALYAALRFLALLSLSGNSPAASALRPAALWLAGLFFRG